MKAFVMIKLGTTEYLGATRTILEEISKLPVVATAYAIFGRYDRLKAISGVQATETFICHE
jgi:hypothetical protein